MFNLKNYPTANTYDKGLFKIDGETININENNAIYNPMDVIRETCTQTEGSDDNIEYVINKYYNGDLSLEDIKSFQAIGDVRQADNNNKIKMQVASHTVPQIYANGTSQTNYTLLAMTTIKQVIIDFNHNELKTPINNISNALITIQTLGTLALDSNGSGGTGSNNQEGSMPKQDSTNQPDYGAYQDNCLINYYLNNNFYNACGFKNLIKTVKNLCCRTSKSTSPSYVEDNIFLLSEKEIANTNNQSYTNEGTQYEFFKTTINKIKMRGYEGTGAACIQWSRSYYLSQGTSYAVCTNTTGDTNYGGNNSYYITSYYFVAPACAI